MKNVILLFCGIALLQSCSTIAVSGGKSTMTGEDSWEDPVGIQATIETKIVEINNGSSLQGGLGISLQGADYKEQYGSGTVKANYIVAPLIYSYQKNKSGIYINAGLQPAILLSAKDKFGGQSYDYKSYMKTFDLGLIAEGGYRFKNNLGIGIRAIPGLTKNHKSGDSRNLLILLRASFVLPDFR